MGFWNLTHWSILIRRAIRFDTDVCRGNTNLTYYYCCCLTNDQRTNQNHNSWCVIDWLIERLHLACLYSWYDGLSWLDGGGMAFAIYHTMNRWWWGMMGHDCERWQGIAPKRKLSHVGYLSTLFRWESDVAFSLYHYHQMIHLLHTLSLSNTLCTCVLSF